MFQGGQRFAACLDALACAAVMASPNELNRLLLAIRDLAIEWRDSERMLKNGGVRCGPALHKGGWVLQAPYHRHTAAGPSSHRGNAWCWYVLAMSIPGHPAGVRG